MKALLLLLLFIIIVFVSPDPNYQLVEPFKRLPNRRWHADYYVEIKNPISMSQIRKKIVVSVNLSLLR